MKRFEHRFTAEMWAACAGYRQMTRRGMFGRMGAAGGSLLAAASQNPLTALAEQLAKQDSSKSARPKSLLMVWLQGGPSQLETFDPHPGSLLGGEAKAIDTRVKGLQIADSLPALAEVMDRTTLVRSVVSKEGDHERATYNLKTGWRPDPTVIHPALGSIVCYQTDESLDIPRHISIQSSQWPARGGYLGPEFDAFQIGDPSQPIPNLRARVPKQRMEKRVGPLLGALESEFQRGRLEGLDSRRTLHTTTTDRALKMMSSEQLVAFDVTQESHSTRESFGDTAFGRGLLAGVRLIEAGVRCVEVELSGWDSHINNHELQTGNCEILDRALASTIRELEDRELLDDTIVFCSGEFGRTPRINAAAGRDHWPHGFSSLLAGGPFRRGSVYGATNGKLGKEQLGRASQLPQEELVKSPVSVAELHATLLSALGIDPEAVQDTPIGRPLQWSDGAVVKELLA